MEFRYISKTSSLLYFSSNIIAEKLGISEGSVVDVSCSFEDLTHVIIVEDV